MHTKSLFALGFIVLFGSGCAFEPAEEAPTSETAAAEESPKIEHVLPVELPNDEVTTAPESEFDDVEPAMPAAGGDESSVDDAPPAVPGAGSDEDDIEAESAHPTDCVVRYFDTKTGTWLAVPCS